MEKNGIGIPKLILDIIELAEKGDFTIGGPEDPMMDGDKFIDYLTPFERACFVTMNEKDSQAKKRAKEADDSNEDKEFVRLDLLSKEAENLMFSSVAERLPDFGYGTKFAIVEGWKIVEMSECDHDCSECQKAGNYFGGGIDSAFPLRGGFVLIDLVSAKKVAERKMKM